MQQAQGENCPAFRQLAAVSGLLWVFTRRGQKNGAGLSETCQTWLFDLVSDLGEQFWQLSYHGAVFLALTFR